MFEIMTHFNDSCVYILNHIMKRFLLILAIACIAPVSLGATEPLRRNSFEVGGGLTFSLIYGQYIGQYTGFAASGAYRHHFGDHFSAGVNVESDFSAYATVMAYGDCRFRSREKDFSPFIGIGVGPDWFVKKGNYAGVWGSVRIGMLYKNFSLTLATHGVPWTGKPKGGDLLGMFIPVLNSITVSYAF